MKTFACLLLGATLVVCAASPSEAQYVLSIDSAQGIENQTAVVSTFLDSSQGIPVQGFSYGLCNNPAEVTPLSTQLGADLAATNGGAGPDFISEEFFTDGMTVGSVVNLLGNDFLPVSNNNELFQVEYGLNAPAGTTAVLQYCGTLGMPNVLVVVVANGATLFPAVTNGSIDILPDAAGTFSLAPPSEASPGAALAVPVLLENDEAVSGLSFGLLHDGNQFDVTSVDVGAELAATNSGAGPDVFNVDLNPTGGAGATVSCVISSAAPFDDIPVGSAQEIAVMNYDVFSGAGPVCAVADFDFVDTLGSPPVPLEVTLSTGAEAANGINNSILIGQPASAPPSGGFTLTAANVGAMPGTSVQVPIELDNDQGVQAFSFGVQYDPTDVSLLAVLPGAEIDATNCGAGADFFGVNLFPNGATVACVVSIGPPFTTRELRIAGDNEVALLGFSVSPSATMGTPIDFVDTLGNPTVGIELTVDAQAVAPATTSGSISLGGAAGDFQRGDCNNDGTNNIADGIFLLGFLFPQGPPNPLDCQDACDTNNDGSLNIADAVLLLDSLFGMPPAVLPGPVTCGADTGGDILDCTGYSNCP